MKGLSRCLFAYTPQEITELMRSDGIPAYRASQVLSWVYGRGVMECAQMSDIPRALSGYLSSAWRLRLPRELERLRSVDHTEKFLLGFDDGVAIEAVSIPNRARVTGCLSTQAGCAHACVFCASGKRGLQRDLTAAEIVGQALFLRHKSSARRLTHIVFMGMGEPLDNYEHLIKAIRIINDPRALHIGARRITISTSGVIPGIERLSREGLQVELSVSLHAVDENLRVRLMPINRQYPLAKLIPACRKYFKVTNRQITFEYLLIEGVNTDASVPVRLAELLRGMDAKVNLIAYNQVASYQAQGAGRKTAQHFKEVLTKKGIVATVRASRGSDIAAACGQLRLKSL